MKIKSKNPPIITNPNKCLAIFKSAMYLLNNYAGRVG